MLKPSTLAIFRTASLLACLAIGVQQFVPLWFVGVPSLPFLHYPLVSLVMQFSGTDGMLASDRLDATFRLLFVLYLLSLTGFTAAFWMRTKPSINRSALSNAGLLSAQIVLGLLINDELLFIVAAEYALIQPLRPGLLWLCAQMMAYTALNLSHLLHIGDTLLICNVSGTDVTPLSPHQRAVHIGLDIAMGVAFQAMAFCIGYLAAAEHRRRIKLAVAHAELLATQQLLGGAVSASERMRIARDLHDAIGHHLTAINLHLDLATRQAGGQAPEPVQTSRELAQRLLAEVRALVSVERQEQRINLRKALKTLCHGASHPWGARVELTIDGELEVRSPALAHAIFLSVQEVIANAIRHDDNAVPDITLASTNDGMTITILDANAAKSQLDKDGSLHGIRKRIEALGGTLDAGICIGNGFGTQIWLPAFGGAQ
ncbi:sensor histidine kinase [Collimonas sp.]|jgi:two-component system sensor histidine kinase DesK|uniref:sensor histidine kinase n=1 Tax=Collimonas sp. TaxID=1963772 RepID=UPI002B5D1788|nr:histidine kinase [Collimonas sp.]HWW05946.1 histidine kinase [Collimonas sp.]